jgi:hypothetical protein
MSTLHAHVDSYTSDCDGGISRTRVERFNEDERVEQVRAYFEGHRLGYDDAVNDFSDIHFMNRVFANVAGPYAVMQSTVHIDEEGFRVEERHEEGVRNVTVEWCKREGCENEDSTYRDHRAESMGY